MGIAGKTIRTRNRAAGVVACAVVALCAALVCSPAQASASTKWTRLGGQTALDTMALVSKAGHASASTAIVATSADYYDALTAASLAGAKDAPILLTDGHALSSQTRAELRRLGATDVIVAGGTAAVSDSVANSIKSLGCSVSRVWGRTAIDTANAIARQVRGRSDTCLVATSTGYWDALSASAYACANDAPIFLTGGGNTLSSSTLAEIRAGGYSKVVICGGTAAVSSSVESQLQGIGVSSGDVRRLGGATAYDTSSLICDWEVSQGMSRDGMVVATGDGFWDALAGSALAGSKGSVIVLVSDSNRTATDAQFIKHNADVSTGYVLGGTAAVSVSTWNYLNSHDEETYTIDYQSYDGYKGTMPDQVVSVGVSTSLTKNTLSCETYTFLGWGTSYDSGVVYTDGQTVKDLAAAGKTVTLYAQWRDDYAAWRASWIASNLSDSMSAAKKIETIQRMIASYTYSAEESTSRALYATGTGDCWAGSEMLKNFCDDLGIKCQLRFAGNDVETYHIRYGEAENSNHRNCFVWIDGVQYLADSTPGHYTAMFEWTPGEWELTYNLVTGKTALKDGPQDRNVDYDNDYGNCYITPGLTQPSSKGTCSAPKDKVSRLDIIAYQHHVKSVTVTGDDILGNKRIYNYGTNDTVEYNVNGTGTINITLILDDDSVWEYSLRVY